MMHSGTTALDSRMQAAVDDLQTLIRQHHPKAELRVSRDPEGSDAIHLISVLDVDDTDLVVDELIDRMMQLQIDEALPIFVVPVRTPTRERAVRAEARMTTSVSTASR